MLEKIKSCFTESIQTQIAAAETLPDAISRATVMIVHALLNGNKILCCGCGGSAIIAQRFATSMVINQFEEERPSLPALYLNTDNAIITSIDKGQKLEEIYAKQVRALGQSGDVLLAISTKGDSRVVIKTVEASLARDMNIVALTGYDGGKLAGLLGARDVEIRIPSKRRIRIQEVHLLTVNCLCDLINNTLFPHQDN